MLIEQAHTKYAETTLVVQLIKVVLTSEVKVHRSKVKFQNAPIELKFLYSDPYDILSILKYFKIYSGSLRGHKGVKGQVYKDAPNQLKINGNTSYDLVDMLKIF